MIELILPATVATEAAYDDRPRPGDRLLSSEREVIARAVESRQREFTTVRHLARRALRRLGHPDRAILPNRRGAPQWPPGIVGSMTHCAGYRAAAVSPAELSAAVSIDAEPNGPLPAGVLNAIALPSERPHLVALAAHRPDVHWDRLLFSAKESVFKAWYPLTQRELDFSEAEIVIDPTQGAFTARLLVPGPLLGGRRVTVFPGRWHSTPALLTTAVHLPAPTPRRDREHRTHLTVNSPLPRPTFG
ncbi:4'-phosphopantetheinyl transferase [Streptomyces noursei]|uniref:NysF n=2 Tax=Streptomyces noursei TaxID=1971 RepID=Q9L4X7_STRNR|nr:NysF [Streptomyces noursei ATCC 11455]AAX37284.1 NysF [Streptomyces noursei ATCC 11455]ANZ14086.1 4'-phosphopantetheinyl transferase [Streptomyces noursei ATCC 11455]